MANTRTGPDYLDQKSKKKKKSTFKKNKTIKDFGNDVEAYAAYLSKRTMSPGSGR